MTRLRQPRRVPRAPGAPVVLAAPAMPRPPALPAQPRPPSSPPPGADSMSACLASHGAPAPALAQAAAKTAWYGRAKACQDAARTRAYSLCRPAGCGLLRPALVGHPREQTRPERHAAAAHLGPAAEAQPGYPTGPSHATARAAAHPAPFPASVCRHGAAQAPHAQACKPCRPERSSRGALRPACHGYRACRPACARCRPAQSARSCASLRSRTCFRCCRSPCGGLPSVGGPPRCAH